MEVVNKPGAGTDGWECNTWCSVFCAISCGLCIGFPPGAFVLALGFAYTDAMLGEAAWP